MLLDALSLQCFLAVAETGSFTRAAARVGRTQSAVSQQIAKLEEQTGKRLFLRAKRLALTDEGQMFLSYARRIHTLQREALGRFREPDLEGEVRFGLPEDFASVYLSEVLAAFARAHPRIVLSIDCDLTLNLYSRFREGAFDLVLVKMNRPEDFPNGIEVLNEPLAWIGNAELAETSGPLPLVLAPTPCVYRAAALRTLDGAGRQWRQVFTSPSHAGAIAAVKAGLGLSVLPRPMIPDGVTPLAAGMLPSPGDIHVSLLKTDTASAAVSSLEAFVQAKLGKDTVRRPA